MKLWPLFYYIESAETVRQNDKLFIDLLHKVRVGNIVDTVGRLFEARFIHKFDENYPKDALHDAINDLPDNLYVTEDDEKIPDICKYPMATIEAAQNKKKKQTQEIKKSFLSLSWCKSDLIS